MSDKDKAIESARWRAHLVATLLLVGACSPNTMPAGGASNAAQAQARTPVPNVSRHMTEVRPAESSLAKPRADEPSLSESNPGTGEPPDIVEPPSTAADAHQDLQPTPVHPPLRPRQIPIDKLPEDFRPPWAWRKKPLTPVPPPIIYSKLQTAKPPWLAHLPLVYSLRARGSSIDCNEFWGRAGPPRLPSVDPDHLLTELSTGRWQLARRTCVGRQRVRPLRSQDSRRLNHLHEQLHPIFADHFLKALEELPEQHPLNDESLMTAVDIAIDTKQLKLLSLVIHQPSEQPLFDVMVLESLLLAFDRLPSILQDPATSSLSLRWTLARNPLYACSTYLAQRLFL